MDRYLLNDILEYRDYMGWRAIIDKLNEEYHDKVYYGEPGKNWGECLRCRRSKTDLWNWRRGSHGEGQISHLNYANNRYKCIWLDVKLPKNY